MTTGDTETKIVRTLLGVRIATDLLEDDLIEELTEIKLMMEDTEYAQSAYERLSKLIEELKSEK